MTFRSFVRSLWDALDPKEKTAESPAPPKKDRAGAYRSAFSAPRGDGFDGGARGRPVDLSGGVKPTYAPPEEVGPPPEVAPSDFVASLDDLGSLVEAQAAEPPVPSSAADHQLDFFEPAGASQPVDVFEYPPPAATELPAVPEPLGATVAATELLVAAGELPVAVAESPADPAELPVAAAESPVAAAELPAAAAELPATAELPVVAAEPPAPPVAAELAAAAEPVTPQHTVALLMAIGPERAAQPGTVEQFSTLELLDTVAHLSPAEEATKEDEAQAVPEKLPLPGT